ncbi:hypothetical protein GIB67_003030 [Kingdonia uniflora]|uniref:Uncharacterized protein n=1 Tax=Kingdonia uniflora TaxID=39325 RepID=A0A7J7LYL6_9MAGN|nr:hypothetical protein GIB67_003030 [Kingdonia uniflora]
MVNSPRSTGVPTPIQAVNPVNVAVEANTGDSATTILMAEHRWHERGDCWKRVVVITGASYCNDIVDGDNEGPAFEPKAAKEAINFKEVKRVDHLLASLHRKLPPAPPPPPFPEGYAPPTSEADNGSEKQQNDEPLHPPPDPIIDQGPSKRMKF